jgi:multiple sugar transport system permease protein/raffinose/stachyose/melibiose transport system permease protein
MRAMKKKKLIRQSMIYILVGLLLIFVLFPFGWMVSIALKTPEEQFRVPPTLLPSHLTLQNFLTLSQHPVFIYFFLNSIFIASTTTLLVVFVTIFCAYGFSRLKFPGRRSLLSIIILTQLFPLAAIIVPIYVIMSRVGLINTYFSLIIAYLSFTVPISVWLLRGFIQGIPPELEEAAMVDGCGRLQAFIKIILPLSRPGIAATAAYIFFVSWQEFMFALTFITDEYKRTLTVGILDFVGQYTTDWGSLMAASVCICLPVFVLFLILQKQLITGLTKGALKA